MDKVRNFDKKRFTNGLITFSKVMVGLVVSVLIIFVITAMMAEGDEIDLGILGVPIILVIFIAAITFIVMLVLEMIASIKESGTAVIGSMLFQTVVIFIVVYALGNLFNENESAYYYMTLAIGIILVDKAVDYWQRYDREYANQLKLNKKK